MIVGAIYGRMPYLSSYMAPVTEYLNERFHYLAANGYLINALFDIYVSYKVIGAAGFFEGDERIALKEAIKHVNKEELLNKVHGQGFQEIGLKDWAKDAYKLDQVHKAIKVFDKEELLNKVNRLDFEKPGVPNWATKEYLIDNPHINDFHDAFDNMHDFNTALDAGEVFYDFPMLDEGPIETVSNGWFKKIFYLADYALERVKQIDLQPIIGNLQDIDLTYNTPAVYASLMGAAIINNLDSLALPMLGYDS
jgi:hypothetical protein